MWCNTCQAAVASVIDFAPAEHPICSRCGGQLTETNTPALNVLSCVSNAPSRTAFDDPWAIDLDLARIKRRVQSVHDSNRPAAMRWAMPEEPATQAACTAQHDPSVEYRVAERSRMKRDKERRIGSFFAEMFSLAVASLVGAGLLIGSRTMVELGLGMGCVVVVVCLLVWIAEPAKPRTVANDEASEFRPESLAA
jgi:hypothetical protein